MRKAPAILASQLLEAPPKLVFKSDHRSRVWLAEANGRAVVVKRFEYSPVRQRLAAWLGLHPAQREARANARLRQDGLSVVPILEQWNFGAALIGVAHVVTPHAGESLQRSLRDGRLPDLVRRRRVLAGVGELAGGLIQKGWYFRDLKTANIILDDTDRPLLIDVGSARRSRSRRKALRMLAMLAHTLRQDGLAPAEQGFWLEAVAKICPEFGDANRLADAIGRIMLK